MMILLVDLTPGTRPRLYAARVRHRDRRRTGFDERRAGRRRAHRRIGSAGRTVHHALGEKHVQLRVADRRAALAAARSARRATVNRRAAYLLAALAALLLVLPLFANNYLLSVATLFLYLRLHGPSVEHDDGLRRTTLPRPRACISVSAATAPARCIFTMASVPGLGVWLAIVVCIALGAILGVLAFRYGISGVYFTLVNHRLRRVHAHRLRSPRLDRRFGRTISQSRPARPHRSGQSARPPGDVLLRRSRSHRAGLRDSRAWLSAPPARLLLAGDPRKRGSRARLSASIPFAGKYSPSLSAPR